MKNKLKMHWNFWTSRKFTVEAILTAHLASLWGMDFEKGDMQIKGDGYNPRPQQHAIIYSLTHRLVNVQRTKTENTCNFR